MENLVKNQNGQPVTTSLLVAKKLKKNHKDVLRAIDNVISQTPESQRERNFAPSEYFDGSGKSNRMYTMTKDGFTAVVLGFTGEPAIKFRWEFIEAFNHMEQIIREALTINVEAVQRNIKRRYLLNTELQKVNRDLNELMKRHKAIKKELRDIDISDFAQLRLFPAYNIEPVKLGFPNIRRAI
ncbi:MAG: Rha family transcriptional regulator [Prevotellaceae bacterium]|jgi:Rha family phage regulatory protein|nr:Rha family transcriptional regulator [Prevotellaceae bacterium]